MTPELEKQLVEKYPKIFAVTPRAKEESEPISYFGIEADDGWYYPLDMLCGAIQRHIDNSNKYLHNKVPQIQATQIKQKFGGLRFYYIPHTEDNYIDGMIALAEYMCGHTCEHCGQPGKLRDLHGYYTTLCDTHEAEDLARYSDANDPASE